MRPPAPPELRLPAAPRPRSGFWISLALHALLVGLAAAAAGRLPRTPPAALLALSPGTAGGGSGDGGGSREREVRYISLPARGAEPVAPRPPHSRATARRPVPLPAIPAPPPASQPIDTAATSLPLEAPAEPPSGPKPGAGTAAAGAGAGAGFGTGTGPGTGGGQGTGPGVGAGGPGGLGAGVSAPEPRQLVLPPPDYPKELKGRQVEVTFFVAADGRVERIAVAPPLPDGGFARRFEEAMRSYRFRPARSPAGAPVPGSTRITVLF